MSSIASIAISNTGLVTSVGQTSPAACAAIRAKLTNPNTSGFVPLGGEPLVGYQVELASPFRGIRKLAQMAAMAMEEGLQNIPHKDWKEIPLILCLAEPERPGRPDALDEELLATVLEQLGTGFADSSTVVAHGRAGLGVAILRARELIRHQKHPHVLLAGVDSLLTWPTLSVYSSEARLLTSLNSNGFVPGEAAASVLLSSPGTGGELRVSGIGFGVERAHVDSGEPLRGDGLTKAVNMALAEAGCDLCDIDYRVSDLSGEQYYFKEASLALNRILRNRREDFEMWHPAECIGEVGAAAGLACLAVIRAAHARGYAPGPRSLVHLANDNGARTAITTCVA